VCLICGVLQVLLHAVLPALQGKFGAIADSVDSPDALEPDKRVAAGSAEPAGSQVSARGARGGSTAAPAQAVTSPPDSIGGSAVVVDTLYTTPRPSLEAAPVATSPRPTALGANGYGRASLLESDVSWFPVSPPPNHSAPDWRVGSTRCSAATAWAWRWAACCRVCRAIAATVLAPPACLLRAAQRAMQAAWRRRWRALGAVAAWAPWLGQLHLAVFYVSGAFFEVPKRFTGARMLFIGSSNAHRKYYGAMGVLLLLQLAARAISRFRSDSRPSRFLLRCCPSSRCTHICSSGFGEVLTRLIVVDCAQVTDGRQEGRALNGLSPQ
jgi:Pex2 / Pex12 amino terminal region